MTALPIIARELRMVARHPFTYSLRMMAVAVLLAVCVFFSFSQGFSQNLGGLLFGFLHCALLLAIWILVPLLTADCISRERREGTMPLLFLTALKPRGIVVAKGIAHGLRAFTLWLAVLPILTIPFLLGGVSGTEALVSACVNFSSLFLALGAGLFASSLSKSWPRAVALAAALCCVLAPYYAILRTLVVIAVVAPFLPRGIGGMPSFAEMVAFTTNSDGEWAKAFAGFSPAAHRAWMLAEGLVTLLSLLAALVLVRLAAWRLQRSWREEPPSLRAQQIERAFCTPILARSLLTRWMRWKLERNPIGWLQQRSWSARLVMWTWFAIVIVIYTAALSANRFYQDDFAALQTSVAALLMVSVGVSAAGSFRRERETGVLELLLIAPLREWQIIGGRLRGLWGQFLPAISLLVALWFFSASAWGDEGFNNLAFLLFYVLLLASLPVIGLYFSLAKAHFMSAFLWTLLFGVALPIAVARSLDLINLVLGLFGLSFPGQATFDLRIAAVIQVGLTFGLASRLHANLKQRKFALEGKAG